MKTIRNLLVVLVALALAGLAKQPYDEKLETRMLEDGLLPEPIELDTREKLGQTSMAIALGGLRSVIATMMNIGAHVHWENQEWYELEQDYRTVVTLQPKTRYYWTVAAWHLSSNAYADYERKPGMPEGRRKRKQRELFDKGIAFLDGGLEANPEDWRMWEEKGNALVQWWRPRDLNTATEAFARAYELSRGNGPRGSAQIQRKHLYALSRIPGREAEAWELAQVMWKHEPNRRFTSPRAIFYALQEWADPPAEEKLSVEEIFGDYRTAAEDLPLHWFRQEEGYPQHGIAEILEEVCDRFDMPESIRPLRYDPERKFSFHPLTGEPHRIDPVTNRPRKREWSSIWHGELRREYLKVLRFHLVLDRAHPKPEDNLSPERILMNRLLATRDLPAFWFSDKEWFPKDEIGTLLRDLCEEFRVPDVLRPMRFPADRRFSSHPETGVPFELDPKTRKPVEKTWREIWDADFRPVYENHLRRFLPPNP